MLETAASDGGDSANTKEKTPMCLLNELARFNKIQHQYTLIDEQGPAHQKTFYVKLELGAEEYHSYGPSIKKAQHFAAQSALETTKMSQPPAKTFNKTTEDGSIKAGCGSQMNTITPTVQLNALAMKRGEKAVYKTFEPPRGTYCPPPPLTYDYRGRYNQRYHSPRVSRLFCVSLCVGNREFTGEGFCRQTARHNAAEKAVEILRSLPPLDTEGCPDTGLLCIEPPEAGSDELKSEISLVHELALRMKLSIDFKVIDESGPPHKRTFVTSCTVGEHSSESEGKSKKLSKKYAAQAMLEKLKQLGPLPVAAASSNKNKPKNSVKKKNRNIIKIQKACPDYGQNINPISRLIQVQQTKKERGPVYSLLEDSGSPRRREFVIQVQVGPHSSSGLGQNKKLAKRNAAEAMLELMGYSKASLQPDKPALKSRTDNGNAVDNKKVTFVDQDASVGRQLVPGVIYMADGLNRAPGSPVQFGDHVISSRTTAVIAKELLDQGASPTAEGLQSAHQTSLTCVVRPEQKLSYLAQVLGFEVQFTDFPKNSNKYEYLTLVSLSTKPPQVSHGAGATIEASHDAAALTALHSLSKMGVEQVQIRHEVEIPPEGMGEGDGNIKEYSDMAMSSGGGMAN